MPRLRLLCFLLVIAAAAAACGGGGRGIVPGAAGLTGPQNTSRTRVTLKMVIPKTTKITSARTRKPEYVSGAIASVVYEITQGTSATSLVTGSDYTNVTTTGSNPTCPQQSGAYVCSIVVPATLSGSGSYNVTIATYDQAQSTSCVPGGTPACTGDLLGMATLPETITVGSTTPVAVTLGGIPAYLQGESLTGYALGSNGSGVQNEITIFGPSPQSGIAQFLDAAGDTIIPPGAPVLTATSSNTNALTVTVATPTPGQYELTWTPVKSGNYVQPGTYTVTLSLAVPNTNIVVNYPIYTTVAHSGVFAGECGGPNVATVYGYLDGNATGSSPDLTIASNLATCSQAPGLATDHNGNLYVADGTTLWEYPVTPGSPSPIASAGSGQGLSQPQTVAVDGNDNVYVGDLTNGLVAFASPGPGGLGSPVATLPTSAFYSNDFPIGGVAADNTGNLYAAVYEDGDFGLFQLPSLQGNLSDSVTPNSIATLQYSAYDTGAAVAVDVQPSPSAPPNVWVGGENASGSAALWYFSSAGSLLNTYTYTSLSSLIQGVAVDGNGTVYAAYSGSTADEITQVTAPSYSAGATLPIPSPQPYAVPSSPPYLPYVSVAVAPAAGVRGASGGGGAPQPLTTASPSAPPAAIRPRKP